MYRTRYAALRKLMMMKLKEDYYKKNALQLAPDLLGKILVLHSESGIKRVRITETEAYYGFDDTASHAHRGKTDRNSIMFEKGGYSYIYLIYGIYDLLNIVSGEKDHPEAVLIRGGIDPDSGANLNGPGKLTKYMGIDRRLNKIFLPGSDVFYLEDDRTKLNFHTEKRVGINYADEPSLSAPWRFIAQI